MYKVLIMSSVSMQDEIVELKGIPRIGDTMPLFYKPYPIVSSVSWLPEKINSDLARLNIDVAITVD